MDQRLGPRRAASRRTPADTGLRDSTSRVRSRRAIQATRPSATRTAPWPCDPGQRLSQFPGGHRRSRSRNADGACTRPNEQGLIQPHRRRQTNRVGVVVHECGAVRITVSLTVCRITNQLARNLVDGAAMAADCSVTHCPPDSSSPTGTPKSSAPLSVPNPSHTTSGDDQGRKTQSGNSNHIRPVHQHLCTRYGGPRWRRRAIQGS
jgi:hypothetical protein